jgi:hypothetical protein
MSISAAIQYTSTKWNTKVLQIKTQNITQPFVKGGNGKIAHTASLPG